MSSPAIVTSSTKAVAMTYEQIKACTSAGRVLPADLKVTTKPNGTPLSVTAASGNAVTTNNKGTAALANNPKASASPAISGTSSSDVSITPLSWADECRLEDIIGRDSTNDLLRQFHPCKVLRPGKPFQTQPVHTKKERAIMHEIIRRVWGDRLIHESAPSNQSMWLWVPGSKVPKWLQTLHDRREANDKIAKGRPANTAAPAKAVSAVRPPPLVPVLPMWGNFAATEKAQSDHKSSAAYYLAMKADEASNPVPKQVNTTILNEKFVQRVVPKFAESETKKNIIPPHLRKAHAMAAATKEAEPAHTTIEATWVAAKLPNACAN